MANSVRDSVELDEFARRMRLDQNKSSKYLVKPREQEIKVVQNEKPSILEISNESEYTEKNYEGGDRSSNTTENKEQDPNFSAFRDNA